MFLFKIGTNNKLKKGDNFLKSIKNSFANCSVCDLLDAPSCIAETNCPQDLSNVDVVFIAENPGKDEEI